MGLSHIKNCTTSNIIPNKIPAHIAYFYQFPSLHVFLKKMTSHGGPHNPLDLYTQVTRE